MHPINTKARAILATAVIALAGSAFAQSAPATRTGGGGGGFDRPLQGQPTRAARPSGAQSTSSITVQKSDGQNTCEVRIVDGQISARLNGKDVPPGRVIHKDDTVSILDENGQTVASFNVSFGAHGGAIAGGVGGATRPAIVGDGFDLGEGFAFDWSPFQQGAPTRAVEPPVMLGITMSEPEEALAAYFEIEPGAAILVDRVLEGLPAQKAGLRRNDIIVRIDGDAPATPETLRERLASKKPGDTIEFAVLRRGGEKTITVKLAAYDRAALGIEVPSGIAGGMPPGMQLDEFPAEFKGLAQIPDSFLSEHMTEEVRRMVEQAMRHGEHRSADQMRRWFDAQGRPTDIFVAPPAQPGRPPQPSVGGGGPTRSVNPPPVDQLLEGGLVFRGGRADVRGVEERIEALNKRVEELSAKLDRLEQLLRRLERVDR